MVVGESGLGKSTLINSLFLTDLYPEKKGSAGHGDKLKKTVNIEASTVEIEERGVKLRLTIVDTPGFGESINASDCYKPIIKYVDDQFERYLNDESGLNRRNISDNRVHCCFYFISPWGHGLKPLDIECMKALQSKVNIVPIIAKADTLTTAELKKFKARVSSIQPKFKTLFLNHSTLRYLKSSTIITFKSTKYLTVSQTRTKSSRIRTNSSK